MNNITHILYAAWSPTNVRFCLYFLCRECWIENMQIFKKERTQMHFMFDDGKCCPICQSKSSRTRSCLLSLHLITMVGEKKNMKIIQMQLSYIYVPGELLDSTAVKENVICYLSWSTSIQQMWCINCCLETDQFDFLTVNVEHCDLKP